MDFFELLFRIWRWEIILSLLAAPFFVLVLFLVMHAASTGNQVSGMLSMAGIYLLKILF